MSWHHRQRWLPVIVIMAGLFAPHERLLSQLPAPTPSPDSVPATDLQISTVPTAIAPTAVQSTSAAPAGSTKPEDIGDSMMVHQRYQAAIDAYKKVPHPSSDVWNKMGIAYQLMFNLEEASHCYQTSIRLNPKNASVLNNLGTVYDSLKEYSDAERMYRKAIKLNPRSAMIDKNLGTNLLSQHKYKKGWEVYKAALEIDPHVFQNNGSPRVQNPASVEDRGAMNFYMAKGCLRAGMNDCAIDYLRMALNEGFTNPKKIEADSEFAALKGVPEFEQLLSAQNNTSQKQQ